MPFSHPHIRQMEQDYQVYTLFRAKDLQKKIYFQIKDLMIPTP